MRLEVSTYMPTSMPQNKPLVNLAKELNLVPDWEQLSQANALAQIKSPFINMVSLAHLFIITNRKMNRFPVYDRLLACQYFHLID